MVHAQEFLGCFIKEKCDVSAHYLKTQIRKFVPKDERISISPLLFVG